MDRMLQMFEARKVARSRFYDKVVIPGKNDRELRDILKVLAKHLPLAENLGQEYDIRTWTKQNDSQNRVDKVKLLLAQRFECRNLIPISENHFSSCRRQRDLCA